MLSRTLWPTCLRSSTTPTSTSTLPPPWVLAKSEDTKPRLARVLYNLAETLRICTVLLQPFMPATCEKIFAQLGVDDGLKTWDSAAAVGSMPANATLHKGENIFPASTPPRSWPNWMPWRLPRKPLPRLPTPPAEEPKAETATASAELIGDHEEEISFDDFCKVNCAWPRFVPASA